MMIAGLINSVGYVACLGLGLLWPALNSIQAIESRTTFDDTQWLTYWLVFSVATLAEATLWPLLKWIPLYHVLKAVGLAWLVLPQFKGAAYIYEQGLLPAHKIGMKHLNELAEKYPQVKKVLPTQPTPGGKLADMAADISSKIHSS